MRPNDTGAPPTGATAQQPQEKYLLGPFVDRVPFVFAFSAASPAFKAGHQAWGEQGCRGAGLQGIWVPGLEPKQIWAYEGAGSTLNFQRKCTTSGFFLLHYSFFNRPWRATTAKEANVQLFIWPKVTAAKGKPPCYLP